jgi:hypothetical protein
MTFFAGVYSWQLHFVNIIGTHMVFAMARFTGKFFGHLTPIEILDKTWI